MRKVVVGGATLWSVAFYAKFCGIVKDELARMEKKAMLDPIPDCPVKRKITKKFADHGYEVFFARQWGSTSNAAVLAYGKKVAFLVFDNGQHTFFTDPELDAARDGIIEHEMAHVLNGDTNQRILSISLGAGITMIATCLGTEALTGGIYKLGSLVTFPSVLSTASAHVGKAFNAVSSQIAGRIPSTIQKNIAHVGLKATEKMALASGMVGIGGILPAVGYCVRQGIDLTCYAGAATLSAAAAGCGSILVASCGIAGFSRYQEKRADYAAIKLKNPAVLDGMAQFFKKLAVHDYGKKSWSDWLHFKMTASHPCSCDRHKYLEREAAKMRQQQQKA